MQFRKFRLIIVLAVLLFVVVSVRAQDATAEPSVEPTPVVVAETPSAENGDTLRLTWTALAGIVSAVFAVGLGGGVVGAVALVRFIRNDKALMVAIEGLYNSVPAETRQRVRGGVEVVGELYEFADDVTDGKPASATASDGAVG